MYQSELGMWLRGEGELFVFSLVNCLGSGTTCKALCGGRADFLKLYNIYIHIYIYPFHGRCKLTFHQNIKEFSIGIPVLVATFTGFPPPWRRRKIRKSQKKRRRPVGDGQKKTYQHSSYRWWKKSCSMWDSGAPVNDILHVNQSASGRISSINTMKYQHLESHLRPSHFLIVFFDLGHSGLESKAILKGIFYLRHL